MVTNQDKNERWFKKDLICCSNQSATLLRNGEADQAILLIYDALSCVSDHKKQLHRRLSQLASSSKKMASPTAQDSFRDGTLTCCTSNDSSTTLLMDEDDNTIVSPMDTSGDYQEGQENADGGESESSQYHFRWYSSLDCEGERTRQGQQEECESDTRSSSSTPTISPVTVSQSSKRSIWSQTSASQSEIPQEDHHLLGPIAITASKDSNVTMNQVIATLVYNLAFASYEYFYHHGKADENSADSSSCREDQYQDRANKAVKLYGICNSILLNDDELNCLAEEEGQEEEEDVQMLQSTMDDDEYSHITYISHIVMLSSLYNMSRIYKSLHQDSQAIQSSQQMLALSILLGETEEFGFGGASPDQSSSSLEAATLPMSQQGDDMEDTSSSTNNVNTIIICNDRNVREAIQTVAVELILKSSIVAPTA